ncbi:LysR family transcriptional regulator [Streptomyces sp. OF3]|uniref:LysR family transcriptional regulator n=1 Tax=Streptomyces alkaliterrae TaxID=2213162 RepID=A0A7W3ZPR5_9ACTN|nr:LysR substrate-binding domain-containing protein [Streptomyces alkaliterrae]MBB1255925.1 LysR family transcriptional regulator [Streptomyces alkaliterrae]
MFDSRRLRTFQEVVRTGSYSAAARSLGYTQPAITQQMKALERELGTALFVRVGRGLRLTEAGETLSRHATTILDTMTVARQQMAARTRLDTGRVRLCAFPSANATLVPGTLAALARHHPGVAVELSEEEPPESLTRVVRGECDIALAFTYPGTSGGDGASAAEVPEELVEIPLLDDQLVVLLPNVHPLSRRRTVTLTDLADERWIAGCLRCRVNFLHECAEQGFAPHIAFTTDDNLMVQSLVAEGLGIALMPSLVLNFLRHQDVVGRPLAPPSRRHIAAYVLREHLRVPATSLVLDTLRRTADNKVGC